MLKAHNPLDPTLDKYYLAYAILKFKDLEESDPFQVCDKLAQNIIDALSIGLTITFDRQLQLKMFSLLGDTYSCVNQFKCAIRSYQEALNLADDLDEILNLELAQLKIYLILQNFEECERKFKDLENYKISHEQNIIVQELKDDFHQMKKQEQQKQQLGLIQQQQQQQQQQCQLHSTQLIINLGNFGSAKKRSLNDEHQNLEKCLIES